MIFSRLFGSPAVARCATVALAGLFVLLLTACGPHARLSITATDASATLRPSISTATYTYEDENTVHIYLSDIPTDRLREPWADGSQRPIGQITHIHMFLRPQPGRTPIDPNASNASIRHIVLAPDGATGLYAGGGFLLPGNSAASGKFSGSIAAGTLVLDAASDNFNDALGAARLRTSLELRQDDALASAIARRMNEAARTIR
ncbi:MAG: hypothetical protein AAGB48_10935 [Planctomycetota bacterium]